MKVPKARKLASGNWFIQLRLNGESVPVTASTEKECTRIATLIKAEHAAGKRQITDKTNITLEQAIDYYISSKKNTLSPSTLRGYSVIKNNRLQSVMRKPVRSINNWQALFDAEAAHLSPKTVKNTHRFIKSVLKEVGYDLPQITLPQIEQKERLWLEPDQILKFVEAVKDEPCEIPALLALHSLRLSEIMALTKSSFDLENDLIFVSGAAVLNTDNKLVRKKTNKNARSTRTVPIMIPRLKTLLEQHEFKDGKLLTCHANTPYDQINRVCERVELPLVGVHGLRHSFASLGYYLRIPELEIMELGGWSDYETVHKVYTHLAKLDRLKSKNKIAEFFSSAAEG